MTNDPPASPSSPAAVGAEVQAPRPGTLLYTALDRTAWVRRTFVDLTRPDTEHDIERLQRHFAASLTAFRTIDAELRQAASEAGPAAGWLAEHDAAMTSDPLLLYLHDAPDLDPEDGERPTLLTWAPDMLAFEMRVVDPRRAGGFFNEGALVRHVFRCETDDQLFAKVAAGAMPSLRRLHKAGVQMLSRYESLHLRAYEIPGRGVRTPPTFHASRPLGPTAAEALSAALDWFEAASRRLAASTAKDA